MDMCMGPAFSQPDEPGKGTARGGCMQSLWWQFRVRFLYLVPHFLMCVVCLVSPRSPMTIVCPIEYLCMYTFI